MPRKSGNIRSPHPEEGSLILVGDYPQCVHSLQTEAHQQPHYLVSTELALLQSNMYEKHGPQYHWVVELFRQLKLPVFDGVQTALED